MKPTKTFAIDVRELQLIEEALNRMLDEKLRLQRCSDANPNKIQAVSAIKEIRSLLGSFHNQKTWFRPKDKVYISGQATPIDIGLNQFLNGSQHLVLATITKDLSLQNVANGPVRVIKSNGKEVAQSRGFEPLTSDFGGLLQ